MKLTQEQQAFFELLRAGLWEIESRLFQFNDLDYSTILRLAEQQTVLGLVTAGLEHVVDTKVPVEESLVFVGNTLQEEQNNLSMNTFLADLIERMRRQDIHSILVKGQGIAQCYERPLWRTCGDIDLYLTENNYRKAKMFFQPLASFIDEEDERKRHLAFVIDSFSVELHGTLNYGLSKRADQGLDEIKKDIFERGNVRSWMNGETQVILPNSNNDVIIIFTHILQHFFYGGIGLRQICDWCRLLWTFREKLDKKLLESRLKKMGLWSEWKAFSTLAVNFLGMPIEGMPFYDKTKGWERKARKILIIILKTGNFGYNRNNSYYKKYPYLVYKAISFWYNTMDSIRHIMIFPIDATRIWYFRLSDGIRAVAKGK